MEAIFILIYVAIIILMIASMWTIFTKAEKPGLAAIVPIYNLIVLLEIVGKPWWWIFLVCIPLINIIFIIWIVNLLTIRFGKHENFTLGLIFFPVIFFPILGFGNAEYTEPPSITARNYKKWINT